MDESIQWIMTLALFVVFFATKKKWWGMWAFLLVVIVQIFVDFLTDRAGIGWFNIAMSVVILIAAIFSTRKKMESVRRDLSDETRTRPDAGTGRNLG